MNKVDVERISGPISILWTGGWDSTYRVVELSRQKVTIQPIYILDPKRESANYELGGQLRQSQKCCYREMKRSPSSYLSRLLMWEKYSQTKK